MKQGHLNTRDLAVKIAKMEGKKKEVSIANIKEILRVIADLELQYRAKGRSDGPMATLNAYVRYRGKRGKAIKEKKE